MSKLPTIGVMLGDATGVGPEIAAKVLASGQSKAGPGAMEHALKIAAKLAAARISARGAAPARAAANS